MSPPPSKPVGGPDAYATLGVTRSSTDDEIRQAYRRLALKSHPDKVGEEEQVEATQRFQEIQAAYEAVCPSNRAHYDAGPIFVAPSLKTPLMSACEARDVEAVRRLLQDDADVDSRDSTGRTAMMNACRVACVAIMRSLLEHSASVEATNIAGHSCLMYAIGAGLEVTGPETAKLARDHLKAVCFLLDEGAPVNSATKYGLSALMLAATSGRSPMVKLLLSRGANVNAATDIGLTALCMGADRGHGEIARLLLGAGADPDSRHGAGKTTLMGAAAQVPSFVSAKAHLDVARALIEGKACVNLASDEGHTALTYAVEYGLKDGLVCPIEGQELKKTDAAVVAELLLQAAADPNVPGPAGRTPLHAACAAQTAAPALVALLMDAGARVDALDAEGRTPADIARTDADSRRASELLALLEGRRRGAGAGGTGGSGGAPGRRAAKGSPCCCCWSAFTGCLELLRPGK